MKREMEKVFKKLKEKYPEASVSVECVMNSWRDHTEFRTYIAHRDPGFIAYDSKEEMVKAEG